MKVIDLKDIPSYGESAAKVYSRLFDITEQELQKIFDKHKIKIDDGCRLHDTLVYSNLARVIHALCEEGKVLSEHLPDDIEFRFAEPQPPVFSGSCKYSSNITFKVGHHTSNISKSQVLTGNKYCLVCADGWGFVSADSTDIEIILLDNKELVLDRQVKIHHLSDECNKFNLDCEKWEASVRIPKGGVLKVAQNCTIEAACPIYACGDIKITGEPGVILKVFNTDEAQPCIGGETATGLSYGRWSIAYNRCKSITIDGVKVQCESVVSNFMLGEMGTNAVPEVICLNDGALDAAEMKGERVMGKSQTHYAGSTKFNDYPVYKIMEKGDNSACIKAESF